MRDALIHIAGQILAAQLAARTDVAGLSDSHLAQIGDASVRAAQALLAAVERAEAALAQADAPQPGPAGGTGDGTAPQN
jgi:nicotinamide mononucleotide (NMN) deamidase PncC